MAINDNHIRLQTTFDKYHQYSDHGIKDFNSWPGSDSDLAILRALIQNVLETQHQVLTQLKELTQEKEFYRIRCAELEKLLDAQPKV